MSEKEWEFDKSFDDYWNGGDTYTRGNYTESSTVQAAKEALNQQLLQKPAAYQSAWQTQINDTIGKITNRDKFSYDVNGDALYQQYKDKYIQQGKLAMQDTMGQAAAMTGGYGNSYAASVGNQAYQAQLNNLNDIIPELYQMAYDRYNQETQDLYNQYSLYADRDNADYGKYRDTVSDWQTDRNYLAGRYDSERGFDYGVYSDNESAKEAQFYADREAAYQQYMDEYNQAYSAYRDSVADDQWEKDYELASTPKTTSTGTTDKGLTPSEWNAINENAAVYAEGGTASLNNYVNGLVNRGWLSPDEAADIVDQYFPVEEEKDDKPQNGHFNPWQTYTLN